MGPSLIPGLADELTAAAGRMHRRRRHRLQFATAGALVVVFAGALAVTATIDAPPAEAGVEITERDGRVEVRLTDVETRPQVVEDALDDAGIDADVDAVPVSPSLVGRFVLFTSSEGGTSLEPIDDAGGTATGFSVPAGFVGHLDLSLGRPAAAGEAITRLGNPLSVGEPLACLDLLGRPVRDLAEVVADRTELTITVQPFDSDGPAEPVPADDAGPYADWILVDATATAPDAIVFNATVDGQPISRPSPPLGC